MQKFGLHRLFVEQDDLAGTSAASETGFVAHFPAVVEEGDFEAITVVVVPEEADVVLPGKGKVGKQGKVFVDCAFAAEAPEDCAWLCAGESGGAGDFVDGVVMAAGDEVVACGRAVEDFLDAYRESGSFSMMWCILFVLFVLKLVGCKNTCVQQIEKTDHLCVRNPRDLCLSCHRQ